MARKKAARRRAGQNISQPPPPANQGAASTSTASAAHQPTTTPATVGEPPGGDPDDGFQVVARRRPPVQHQPEPGSFGPEGDVAPPALTCHSADPELNVDLNFLFAKLEQALTDPSLNFNEIMAEIYRRTNPEPSNGTVDRGVWFLGVTEWQEIAPGYGNASGWRIGNSGPSDPRTQGRRPTPAISTTNVEQLPEPGPRRHAVQGTITGSRRNGQLPQAPVAQRLSTSPPRGNSGDGSSSTLVSNRNIPPLVPPPPSPAPLPPPQTPIIAPAAAGAAAAKSSVLDCCKLAEDASVLLKLYSKTAPDSNDAAQQLIYSAYASVTKLNRHHRVLASGTDSGKIGAQKRHRNEDLTVDAGCIICYSKIADTVLLPCHHLVLCSVSD